MTVLLGVCLTPVRERSLALIGSSAPLALVTGSFMLFLRVVAAWGIFLELRFGLRIEKLGEVLKQENAWPRFEFELRPSGLPTKDSAEAIFGNYRAMVEADESNWRTWFALGLAYDAAGDRARARKAMRQAIALGRTS